DYGWSTLARLASGGHTISNISVITDSSSAGNYVDWSDLDGMTQVPGRAKNFGLERLRCAGGSLQAPGSSCTGRHTDYGVNVVYADGHARFVLGERIQGGLNDPRGEFPIV